MSKPFNALTAVLAVGLIANAGAAAADAVETRDAWTERFEVPGAAPRLEIRNIWGDVRVEPGAEGEIVLAIREHREAPNQALHERSKEIYDLRIEANGDAIDVRVGKQGQSWFGRDPCSNCRVEYQFEVRVPPGTQLYASTINDGEVVITGVEGEVSAANVNGPVTIHRLNRCGHVDSVNGDVSLDFSGSPGADCKIETINGDIRLQLPQGAGLDLAIDLFNGRVTTELPVDPLAIPPRVEQQVSNGSTKYRIEQAAGVRLAGGGPVFKVSSMNGDLRIEQLN